MQALQAFLVSAGAIVVSEIGDKTQLLAMMLAARFRRPWPIVLGIACATLANHVLAGLVGAWLRSELGPDVLRWVLGVSFLLAAGWALKPDQADDEPQAVGHAGVFVIAAVSFFLAEMGDKTQLATAMLAARYPSLAAVVAGTTVGMLVADVPVVFLGHKVADRIPFRAVRIAAALAFAALGLATLLSAPG
jgi:Ca2+/H+ antiporter, TMEM165/GDT1 family